MDFDFHLPGNRVLISLILYRQIKCWILLSLWKSVLCRDFFDKLSDGTNILPIHLDGAHLTKAYDVII